VDEVDWVHSRIDQSCHFLQTVVCLLVGQTVYCWFGHRYYVGARVTSFDGQRAKKLSASLPAAGGGLVFWRLSRRESKKRKRQ
jgi:hypothetical protein